MMPQSLNILLPDNQAARLEGQVLLIVPMTPEELSFLGAATVAQAEYIEANRAEFATHLSREEGLGTADEDTMRQLRLLAEVTGNLAAASLAIRDILQRRLIVSQGKDSLWAGQWGRA
jgi:hypothetical protein